MSDSAPIPALVSSAPPSPPHAPRADEPPAAELTPQVRLRRPALWVALVGLLLVAQSLLLWLTFAYESNRAQEEVELAAAGVAGDVRRAVSRDLQGLQAMLWTDQAPLQWQPAAREMLRTRRELLRIERRSLSLQVVEAIDSPFEPGLFSQLPREAMDVETEIACTAASRLSAPAFSRSYFVPLAAGMGVEVIDVCLPEIRSGRVEGYVNTTLALSALLTEAVGSSVLRTHELSFIDGDGARLVRAGVPRGAGVYVSERLIDLPGQTLRLRVDSRSGRPQLIPNLAVALVLGLSLALGAVVALLARDGRRRASAELALAEALAFRKAMEDSLLTGLRARDMSGRVSYVNPAFCEMVGFSAEEIIGRDPPPYWPPELIPEYQMRKSQRLRPVASPVRGIGVPARGNSREGFETTFVRKNGERFEVLIFEAPLVNGAGRQTGWMSAALDVSDQRRMEELARQQQERLQATARLATVGEMASLLSHELNQPLAAIASYAAGSLNLMREGDASGADDAQTRSLLRQAAVRISEQAERAGRVIKSVHDFVRRREQAREPVRVEALVDAVLPLVRLQARKSGARVDVDLAAGLPRVLCDRTMVEQVLLNLTRNGIQAMEEHTPPGRRELLIRVRCSHPRWLLFSVIDHGPGIPDDVARRLFTPFFTTRSEGMGLGLSLCRTVIEQHGGVLDHLTTPARPTPGTPSHDGTAAGSTTEFRFTLPAEAARTEAAPEQAAQSEPA